MSLGNEVRLNKFISESGHCSRREADRLIESNRVRINGKLPELGTKVATGDEVTVDGMQIYGRESNQTDRIYLAYNKPVGITCTTEQPVKGNIIDAVDHDERIFPIGRLDKPSEGLILLTNDGDIVNKILRAENSHDKEYRVTVDKKIAPGFVEKMSSGVPILNTVTKPCKVIIEGKSTFKITLTQGLNRQIRRMCEHLGYEVLALQRLRIMNINLGKLRSGQWRNLTRDELAQLNKAIAQSSNESSKTPARKQTSPNNKKKTTGSANHKKAKSTRGYSEQKKGSSDNRNSNKNRTKSKTGSRTSATSKKNGQRSTRNTTQKTPSKPRFSRKK